MLTTDPIAVRVVRRYVHQLRAERIAREVQRREGEGLVTVREDDDDEGSPTDSRATPRPDARHDGETAAD
jgi:hypothetical protein